MSNLVLKQHTIKNEKESVSTLITLEKQEDGTLMVMISHADLEENEKEYWSDEGFVFSTLDFDLAEKWYNYVKDNFSVQSNKISEVYIDFYTDKYKSDLERIEKILA